MASQLISERTSPALLVDGADLTTPGIARGVVICGLTSANKRDYPPAVLRKAVKKYEGVSVYLDHLDESGRSRGVREWFGELRNVRSREDGRPEGDLHFPQSHAFAAEFTDRARNFPRSLGLSHVAECETRRVEGRDRVEDIRRVESVDLVASPATVKGLYEGREVGRTTIRAIFERNPERMTLVEQDMDAEVMDAEVMEPAADMPHEDALWAGFVDAMHTLFNSYKGGTMTAEEAGKEVSKYLKAHQKLTKPKGEGGEETPSESRTADEDDAVIREAMAVCKKVGYRGFDETDLDIISRTPEADREAVAKRLMEGRRAADEGEPVRSAGRHGTAAALTTEAKKGSDEGPKDAADFLRRVME